MDTLAEPRKILHLASQRQMMKFDYHQAFSGYGNFKEFNLSHQSLVFHEYTEKFRVDLLSQCLFVNVK